MKNWEKYEKEILELTHDNQDIAVLKGKPVKCLTTDCKNCDLRSSTGGCNRLRVIEWLYKEYVETVELSRLEYEMLKYLKTKGYKYLARDKDYIMYMYPQKPRKDERKSEWYVDGTAMGVRSAGMLNDIFEWVKWNDPEPTSIETVLNNCTIKEEE